jgi:asparagine N-glycosylation enzyme membrane subunit Stt3
LSRLGPLLVLSLVLVAFAARERVGAARRLPAGETLAAGSALASDDVAGTTWCIDDARSAWHMRRVELALAARRLPSFDRSIGHPDGREAPDGPLYATLLAFVGERLAPRSGDASLGGIDERGLERVLAHASPVLGALAVLAALAAGAALARPGRRLAAGLAAGAVYAFAPAALVAGAAGHLDERVWLDLAIALHAYVVVRALGAREALDRMQGALLAGLVAGLAVPR